MCSLERIGTCKNNTFWKPGLAVDLQSQMTLDDPTITVFLKSKKTLLEFFYFLRKTSLGSRVSAVGEE